MNTTTKQTTPRTISRGGRKQTADDVTLAGTVAQPESRRPGVAQTGIPHPGKVSKNEDERVRAMFVKQDRLAKEIATKLDDPEIMRFCIAYSETKRGKEIAPLQMSRLLEQKLNKETMTKIPEYKTPTLVKHWNADKQEWTEVYNGNPWAFKQLGAKNAKGKRKESTLDWGDVVIGLLGYMKTNRDKVAQMKDAHTNQGHKPAADTPKEYIGWSQTKRDEQIDLLDTVYKDHKEIIVNGIRFWQAMRGVAGLKHPNNKPAFKIEYAEADNKFLMVEKPIRLRELDDKGQPNGEVDRFSVSNALGWNIQETQAKGPTLERLRESSPVTGTPRNKQAAPYFSDNEELAGVLTKLLNTFRDTRNREYLNKLNNDMGKPSPDNNELLLLFRDTLVEVNSFYSRHRKRADVLAEQRANAAEDSPVVTDAGEEQAA